MVIDHLVAHPFVRHQRAAKFTEIHAVGQRQMGVERGDGDLECRPGVPRNEKDALIFVVFIENTPTLLRVFADEQQLLGHSGFLPGWFTGLFL